MQTISAAEFAKRYGQDSLNKFTPNASRPSIGEAIANSFKSGVSQVKSGFDQINSGNGNPVNLAEGVGKMGAGAINAAFSPLAPAVDATAGKAINFVADKISNSPAVQKFADSKAGQVTSRVAEDVGNYANIASTVGGLMEAPNVTSTIKNGAANIAEKTNAVITDTGNKLGSAGADLSTKASDLLTHIPENVKTELTKSGIKPYTMAAKVKEYFDAGKQAMTDSSKPTPMEVAGEKANNALSIINDNVQATGQKLGSLTKAYADKTVDGAVTDAKKFISKELIDRTGTMITKAGEVKKAIGRESKISNPSDINLLKDVNSKLTAIEKNPTFQKVSDTVDYMQSKLFERKGVGQIPINSQVEGLMKEAVYNLNSKLRDVGGAAYQKLNDNYFNSIGLRNDLNKALGVEGNKGASLMKQLFSPNGTMPKKLFDTVKKATGIDLVNEATLAKWAMENVGDSRQSSLLQQTLEAPQQILSKSGIINKAVGKVVEKLKKPQEKAMRIIKSNIKK